MIAGNGTKMKDRWNIVGCVLFCFVVFGVQAQQQHPVNKKAWGLFQQARESFREGDKEKALGLLLKAETFDQGFSPLYLLKADIYNKKGDKIQEIRAIETALALDSLKSHPYYYFILAEYYFDEADYGKALAHYGRYLSWDKRLQVKAVAERQMENCRFALEALRTQTKQPPEVFYEAGCPVYWPALDVTGQTFLFTEQAGEQETMWMLQGDRRYALNFSDRENYGAPSLTADGRIFPGKTAGIVLIFMWLTACRIRPGRSRSIWAPPSIPMAGRLNRRYRPTVHVCILLLPVREGEGEAIFGFRIC